MPEIKGNKDIEIKLESALEPFMSFQSETRTFTFDKARLKEPKNYVVKLQLVDKVTQAKKDLSFSINIQRKIDFFTKLQKSESENTQEHFEVTRRRKVDLKSTNLIASISAVSVYG